MLNKVKLFIISLLVCTSFSYALAKTKQTITFEADNSLIENSTHTLIGNVKISGADFEIDGIKATLNKKLQKATIFGNNKQKAKFCQTNSAKQERICGEALKIDYDINKHELLLSQQAVVTRYIKQELKDKIEGETIKYNQLSKSYVINEAVKSTNKRVKITITPDSVD